MNSAFNVGLNNLLSIASVFSSPPLVYFVAVVLVGLSISVAKIFVPMNRR